MRLYHVAPFLLLASSLSAQRPFRVEIEAPSTNTFAAALNLLTDWGFPIQLAEEENGVIITNNLTTGNATFGNVSKLLGKRASYWLDCGKENFFSLTSTADYINYQFIILIAGDSSVSIVKVKFFASAVQEDDPLSPTACNSRKRLEPVLFDSLRARVAASP